MTNGTGLNLVSSTQVSASTWGRTTTSLTVFVKKTNGSHNEACNTTLGTMAVLLKAFASLTVSHMTSVRMVRLT